MKIGPEIAPPRLRTQQHAWIDAIESSSADACPEKAALYN